MLGATRYDAQKIEFTEGTTPLSNYMHYGNMHSYFAAGALPETAFPSKLPDDLPPGSSTMFASVAPSGRSDTHTKRMQYYSWYVSKAKPMIMTETNLHESITRVPELPRILIESFRTGIKRTYIYSMINTNGGYGLFALDAPYAPRATGTAVHNLTTILADTASSYTPTGSLDYTVSGAANARHFLFQKSDDSYWLAVWLSAASTAGSKSLTLTFNDGSHTIQQYKDLNPTPLAAQGPNTSFTGLQVGPTVSIFKIT